jgi:hypothetical protein
MNRWTEDSGGTKAKNHEDWSSEDRSPVAYTRTLKTFPAQAQHGKLRKPSDFSKGLFASYYVKNFLSLHNT